MGLILSVFRAPLNSYWLVKPQQKSANQRAAFSADSIKVQHGENKGKAVSDSAQHMIL